MFRRFYAATSAFTLLLMMSSHAAAQTSQLTPQDDVIEIDANEMDEAGFEAYITQEYETRVSDSQNLVSDAILNSETAGGKGRSAQLSFTTEGSSASLKVASSDESNPCETYDEDATSCWSTNWNLTFAAPFDNENGALLNLATLDGLASGVNATFVYSFGGTRGVDINEAIAKSSGVDVDLIAAREACINDPSRETEEVERCRKTTRYTSHSKDGEFPEDADHLISAYFPDALQARDSVFKGAYSYFINVEGKVNYEDFDFIDPADLSSQSTEEFEYSAGLSATLVTLGERQLGFTTGVKFQSDFKQADEGINCLNDMDEISCVSGRPLAPERKESLLGFSEFRYIFDDVPGFGKVGIAPRLTHDFDEDVTGINLPIFLASGEGNLSSGFQVGWRSDTDEIVAGFFVGTELNIFQASD